jgi:hypothetical protein
MLLMPKGGVALSKRRGHRLWRLGSLVRCLMTSCSSGQGTKMSGSVDVPVVRELCCEERSRRLSGSRAGPPPTSEEACDGHGLQ